MLANEFHDQRCWKVKNEWLTDLMTSFVELFVSERKVIYKNVTYLKIISVFC